jgi:hypothetical protein
MTDRVLPVVLAKARTHTAESLGESRMAVGLRNNNVLWLWVPAFAGTTSGGEAQ